jgi:hypothetical protein
MLLGSPQLEHVDATVVDRIGSSRKIQAARGGSSTKHQSLEALDHLISLLWVDGI